MQDGMIVLAATAFAALAASSVEGSGTQVRSVDGSRTVERFDATSSKKPSNRDQRDSSMDWLSDQKALQVTRRFASCVVARNSAKAATFALSPMDKVDAESKKLKTVFEACLEKYVEGESRLKANAHALQGFLAESIVRRDVPMLQTKQATPGFYGRPWIYANPDDMLLEQTAVCVAQVRPNEAIAVVTAEPASADEDKAIFAVRPALQDCVDPHSGFRGSRTNVRLALALALLHRRYDAPATTDVLAVEKN